MRIFSFALLVILLSGLLAWLGNRPQDAGSDVPHGKLNSLSFAPYWDGQTPFDKTYPSVEQIATDIQLMAEKTHTIRTYASAEGNMPAIPELAKKYGVAMLQGAWLGPLDAKNKEEVEALIRAANAYPDVVKRVMVGNEVLLRRDLKADQVVKYIRMVKAQVKQPVSYADVWSMYLQHPELINEVDFITIHILPYWEDEPISVEQAPAHIERIYKQVREYVDTIAPGKPILIGESGWPSQGRQRGGSVPGVVNEATFVRNLLQVANKNGFDVNIVEAINQSWKSALEGVVGANWGLFAADRTEVFPLTGPVQEKARWPFEWLAASLLLVAGLLAGRSKLEGLATSKALAMVLFLQVLTGLLVTQGWFLWVTSYTFWQNLLTLVVLAANAVFGWLAWQQAGDALAGRSVVGDRGRYLYSLYVLLVGFAVFRTFMMSIDGRYISFPTPQLSIMIAACVALVGVAYAKGLRGKAVLVLDNVVGNSDEESNGKQDRMLGWVLLFTGVALCFGETYGYVVAHDLIVEYPDFAERLGKSLSFTFGNGQLLMWLLGLGFLASPLVNNAKPDVAA
ncbi:hypothetical protein JCM14076_20640 [Methylosoma difficile]